MVSRHAYITGNSPKSDYLTNVECAHVYMYTVKYRVMWNVAQKEIRSDQKFVVTLYLVVFIVI